MKKQLLESLIQFHSYVESGKKKYSLKKKSENFSLKAVSNPIQDKMHDSLKSNQQTLHQKEDMQSSQKNENQSYLLVQPEKKENFPNEMGALKVIVDSCMKCRLYRSRKKTVFGTGSAKTKLMVIGEAPGADEDSQGAPFVGKAGQLLTKMLFAIQIKREDIFITNILKCRPPQNRDPKIDEIETCTPYLEKQLELVEPEVILTLGGFATQFILGREEGITSLRGKSYEVNGRIVIPTFHPSALLRNEKLKYPAWEDLKMLHSILEQKGFYQKS